MTFLPESIVGIKQRRLKEDAKKTPKNIEL